MPPFGLEISFVFAATRARAPANEPASIFFHAECRKAMVRPCELKVGSLRKQVTSWRRQHLKPVSRMRLKDLELQFDQFEDLLDYLSTTDVVATNVDGVTLSMRAVA